MAICPGTLGAELSGTSLAFCAGTLQNLISHLRPNRPEPHQPPTPEPFGTSSASTYLPRNPPQPHQTSAPEPSITLSTICTATLRNLNLISNLRQNRQNPESHLPRNPPEPHQPSAPEPSALETPRNLISHLHRNPLKPHLRNPPEPCPELGVAAAPDRTRAILG